MNGVSDVTCMVLVLWKYDSNFGKKGSNFRNY